VITPDKDYRPNPKRAVFIQGTIDQPLIDRLTPQIISLTADSSEPITVYIDSPGGSPSLMEALLRLLTVSDQDLTSGCRVITVVTNRAASAAADLLSSGDYAIAYPGSSVLYHGTRISQDAPLTTEWTSMLVDYLRESNSKYATKLARKIIDRFMFRFVSSKEHFDEIRKADPTQKTDLDCFLEWVEGNLSPQAQVVLKSARKRYDRYLQLLNWVVKKVKSPVKPRATFEAAQIKAIVDFELRTNKDEDEWTFSQGGINNLTDDFFLLNEYLRNFSSGFFKYLCLKYGSFLLSDAETKELEKADKADRQKKEIEKVSPLLLPVWSFFVALCHALQHGENDLTARDAVWLGLVDEVLGADELPCRRLVYEYQQDDEPAQIQSAVVPAQLAAAPEQNDNEEARGQKEEPAQGTEAAAGA
jgi:ClpP protease-like protein